MNAYTFVRALTLIHITLSCNSIIANLGNLLWQAGSTISNRFYAAMSSDAGLQLSTVLLTKWLAATQVALSSVLVAVLVGPAMDIDGALKD